MESATQIKAVRAPTDVAVTCPNERRPARQRRRAAFEKRWLGTAPSFENRDFERRGSRGNGAARLSALHQLVALGPDGDVADVAPDQGLDALDVLLRGDR